MHSSSDTFQARLRVLQIIAAALLLGVALCTAMFVFIKTSGYAGMPEPKPESEGGSPYLVTIMAAVFMVINASLAFTLPKALGRNMLAGIAKSIPEGESGTSNPAVRNSLLSVYQSTLIVGLALIEGASLLGCIAYFVDAKVVALAVPAVGVMLMLLKFPSEGRVSQWLDATGLELQELRRVARTDPHS